MKITPQIIEDYALAHSSKQSKLLSELFQETYRLTELPQMLSGPIVGQFLKMMVQALNAKRVLELGTFTGYSALWMAEGLSEDGKLTTCELIEENAKIARSFFDRSEHGKKIEILLGPGQESLERLSSKEHFDFIFIDADKSNYGLYYDKAIDLLKVGGLIVFDNCLWDGKVLDPQDSSTMAIDRINKKLNEDTRIEHVLLTVRDGLHLVRKLRNH